MLQEIVNGIARNLESNEDARGFAKSLIKGIVWSSAYGAKFAETNNDGSATECANRAVLFLEKKL